MRPGHLEAQHHFRTRHGGGRRRETQMKKLAIRAMALGGGLVALLLAGAAGFSRG
jgi:hypothetical protein